MSISAMPNLDVYIYPQLLPHMYLHVLICMLFAIAMTCYTTSFLVFVLHHCITLER